MSSTARQTRSQKASTARATSSAKGSPRKRGQTVKRDEDEDAESIASWSVSDEESVPSPSKPARKAKARQVSREDGDAKGFYIEVPKLRNKKPRARKVREEDEVEYSAEEDGEDDFVEVKKTQKRKPKARPTSDDEERNVTRHVAYYPWKNHADVAHRSPKKKAKKSQPMIEDEDDGMEEAGGPVEETSDKRNQQCVVEEGPPSEGPKETSSVEDPSADPDDGIPPAVFEQSTPAPTEAQIAARREVPNAPKASPARGPSPVTQANQELLDNIMDNFKKFQQEYGVDGDIDIESIAKQERVFEDIHKIMGDLPGIEGVIFRFPDVHAYETKTCEARIRFLRLLVLRLMIDKSWVLKLLDFEQKRLTRESQDLLDTPLEDNGHLQYYVDRMRVGCFSKEAPWRTAPVEQTMYRPGFNPPEPELWQFTPPAGSLPVPTTPKKAAKTVTFGPPLSTEGVETPSPTKTSPEKGKGKEKVLFLQECPQPSTPKRLPEIHSPTLDKANNSDPSSPSKLLAKLSLQSPPKAQQSPTPLPSATQPSASTSSAPAGPSSAPTQQTQQPPATSSNPTQPSASTSSAAAGPSSSSSQPAEVVDVDEEAGEEEDADMVACMTQSKKYFEGPLDRLLGGRLYMYSRENGFKTELEGRNFETAFAEPDISRLRRLEDAKPRGYLMRNLAHANPAEFYYPPQIDRKALITFKNGPWKGKPVHFLLLGTATAVSTHSGEHNRSISIVPTGYTVQRMVAVIHATTGQALMNVTNNYGGMVISTRYAVSPSSQAASAGKAPEYVNGDVTWPESPLAWNNSIACYDGTKGVTLPTFPKLKMCPSKIFQDDAVAVFCTIGLYSNDKLKYANYTRVFISLNAQAVILVAKPKSSLAGAVFLECRPPLPTDPLVTEEEAQAQVQAENGANEDMDVDSGAKGDCI